MGMSFFVLMQKRADGKRYASLEKTNQSFFLTADAADGTRLLLPNAEQLEVVELVAELREDWDNLIPADLADEKLKPYAEHSPTLLLAAGEMSPQELRTAKAVVNLCRAIIKRIVSK